MFYTSALFCHLTTTTAICNPDDDNDGPSKSSKATTDRASLPILRLPLSTLFKFSSLSHPLSSAPSSPNPYRKFRRPRQSPLVRCIARTRNKTFEFHRCEAKIKKDWKQRPGSRGWKRFHWSRLLFWTRISYRVGLGQPPLAMEKGICPIRFEIQLKAKAIGVRGCFNQGVPQASNWCVRLFFSSWGTLARYKVISSCELTARSLPTITAAGLPKLRAL